MVAVDDVNRNVALSQPLHLPAECKQSPQAAVTGVIEVTGQNEEIGFCRDRMINDAFESSDGSGLELFSEFWRDVTQAPERAVQMKIGCMDKTQWLHAAFLSVQADNLGDLAA